MHTVFSYFFCIFTDISITISALFLRVKIAETALDVDLESVVTFKINVVHYLFITTALAGVTCFINFQPDPSHSGALRWGLLINKHHRCNCTKVIAKPTVYPQAHFARSCDENIADIWFTDKPGLLTDARVWNTEKLKYLINCSYTGKARHRNKPEKVFGELSRIWGARDYTTLHLIFENVSDFSSQNFECRISDIVLDIRNCYDASHKAISQGGLSIFQCLE